MLRNTVFLSLVLVMSGCAGGEGSPKEPAKTAEQPALRIGHYSTGDGMHGLVIDRSGSKAKIRVDGEKGIIELTAQAGDRDEETKLVDPSGKARLLIDASGGVLWFDVGKRVYRDADADPLGSATVAGEAEPPPPSAYDVELEKITKAAVVGRLDGFVPADAGDLDKVQRAIEQTDKALLVHVTKEQSQGVYMPVSRWVGNERYIDSGFSQRKSDQGKDEGLRKYGGVLGPYVAQDSAQWIEVDLADDVPGLAAGTPGIVWEMDGAYATFVTFDGGRYRVSFEDLALGLPKGKRPPALQHTLLGETDVEFLARAGHVEKDTYEALHRHNVAFRTCVQEGWQALEKRIDTLARKDMDWSTRAHRAQVMSDENERKLPKTCGKHVDAFEKALVDVIAERVAARRKLAEAVKVR